MVRKRNEQGQFVENQFSQVDKIKWTSYIRILIIIVIAIPWIYFLIFRLDIINKVKKILENNLFSPPCTCESINSNDNGFAGEKIKKQGL